MTDPAPRKSDPAPFTTVAGLVLLLFGPASFSTPAPLPAQETHPSHFSPELLEEPAVEEALTWLEENFESQVEDWIRITEIPAPSGMEDERAAWIAEELRRDGFEVSFDDLGNLIVRWPGTSDGPTVVFGAHLDTVHPLDADVSVTRQGDTLRAPGVYDNSASLANMMAVLRALKHADLRTRGDLIFIGTVEEEVGFVGMAHWLDRNPGVADMAVAMDGGLGSVSYGALWFGGRRYIFRGEGAHTLSSWGRPHPARALADAIRAIYEIELPEERDFSVFNVGMLEGGSVTNAIPQEVWFTVDLRSVDPEVVDLLGAEMDARVERVAGEHGVEWERDPPSSPSMVEEARAMLPEEERRSHPLVETAVDVYRHLGIDAPARNTGSTDAVAAVRRGIPAIAMGRSRGGDQHTLSEWSEVSSALPATQAVLLVAVKMAGLASP